MDEAAWRTICETYGPHFEELVHVRGLVRQPAVVIDLVLKAFSAATTRLGRSDTDLPSLRAFRDTCLDYRATERLMCGAFWVAAPSTDLDTSLETPIHSWLSECTGFADLCVVLNELGSWDPDLADFLYQRFIEPLVEAGAALPRGIDWYCFVAGSGQTPFGIHIDAEPSFVVNLGPAEKTAWVWSREALPTLANGRPRTTNSEPLIADAECFQLAPGDFLLIPAGMYHLFRNDGPTILLGLTVYPDDPDAVAMDALRRVCRNWVSEKGASRTAAASVQYLRDALEDNRVERSIEHAALWRRSCGYGYPPRFPGRARDAGPPYAVTGLPIVKADGRVHALGSELSVDVAEMVEALVPGAHLSAAQLRTIAPQPEDQAVIRALVRVGALRSVRRS